MRRAGHRRAREHSVGLTGAGRRSRACETFLGRGRAPRRGASPRGTLADTSRTRDRGSRPPGLTRPLYKHAPTASPHPLRTASTTSRPARELERPATAVPVPSRGSHPGTRRGPHAPRRARRARLKRLKPQATQLRVFPDLFSKVRPIPHPRSPRRVRARCCVHPRRLGAARSLFRVVGSSLLRQHGRRAGGLARAANERPGPLRPRAAASLLLTFPPRAPAFRRPSGSCWKRPRRRLVAALRRPAVRLARAP